MIDPADPRRCEVCHSQTTGAAQAKAFLTQAEPGRLRRLPRRRQFRHRLFEWSGANHPGGFQRTTPSAPTATFRRVRLPFDASIMGAHVVPTDTAATYPQNPDTLLAGINLAITSVTNTSAGQTPTVNFTLQDNKGNNIPLSQPRASCNSPWPVLPPTTATPVSEATPPALRVT